MRQQTYRNKQSTHNMYIPVLKCVWVFILKALSSAVKCSTFYAVIQSILNDSVIPYKFNSKSHTSTHAYKRKVWVENSICAPPPRGTISNSIPNFCCSNKFQKYTHLHIQRRRQHKAAKGHGNEAPFPPCIYFIFTSLLFAIFSKHFERYSGFYIYIFKIQICIHHNTKECTTKSQG